MKRILAASLSLCFVLASSFVFAQTPGAGGPPPKVLTQGLVDRFIADMPGLVKDFKALGDEYNAQSEPAAGGAQPGSPASLSNAFAAIRADSRARAILTRHGWQDSFWQVYTTILFGYMATMMDDAYTQSQQPMMKQYADQYRTMVHPDDVALVAKNKDRIQQLFESMKDNG